MAFKKFLVDIDLSKNQLLNAVVQNLATAPSNPLDGQIYWDTAQDSLFVYSADSTSWIDLGSDGVTNLGYTASSTQGVVTSDSGTDATIPAATASNAGLLLPAEKTTIGNQSGTNTGDNAINSRYESLETNVTTDLSSSATTTAVTVASSDGTDATISAASTSQAGVMTKAMFDKLDGIEAGAQANVAETVTSLSLSTNTLTYTDENGTDTDIDLSLYLDDTNLARLTSGSIDGSTGIATFTRDDASTFTVDMSAFLDGITVNNTLTSTSTTEGLSAAQGKVLKDLIDALPTEDTQLTDAEIAAFGYIKTDTNTQLSDEEVQDIVGAMVSSNTESNISVTYDDASGKLNFSATDTNTQLSDADIAAFGYIKTDTNTQLSDSDIAAFGYVKSVAFDEITGNQTDLDLSGFTNDLRVEQDCAAALSTTVTHSLGNYVNVNVYNTSSPYNEVEAQVESTSSTSVTVTFNTAPTAGQYKIVVTK